MHSSASAPDSVTTWERKISWHWVNVQKVVGSLCFGIDCELLWTLQTVTAWRCYCGPVRGLWRCLWDPRCFQAAADTEVRCLPVLSALPLSPGPSTLMPSGKNRWRQTTKCRRRAKATHLNNTDPAGEKEVSVISVEAREGTGPDWMSELPWSQVTLATRHRNRTWVDQL